MVMKNLVVDYLEGRYSDKWTDTWKNDYQEIGHIIEDLNH